METRLGDYALLPTTYEGGYCFTSVCLSTGRAIHDPFTWIPWSNPAPRPWATWATLARAGLESGRGSRSSCLVMLMQGLSCLVMVRLFFENYNFFSQMPWDPVVLKCTFLWSDGYFICFWKNSLKVSNASFSIGTTNWCVKHEAVIYAVKFVVELTDWKLFCKNNKKIISHTCWQCRERMVIY